MEYKLEDLEERYELELDKISDEISEQLVVSSKQSGFKVLLQLPDGLKPYGLVICDYVSAKTGADVSIWLGNCFGACDLPDSDADLVIQFGHAVWK